MKDVTGTRYRYVRSRASRRRWRNPLYLLLASLALLVNLVMLQYLVGARWVPGQSPKYLDDTLRVVNDGQHVQQGSSSQSMYIRRVLLQEKTATEAVEGNIATEKPTPQPLYPKDLFSMKQKQQGAVILHVIGMVYMFGALAIVCDEFFVPSLDVIIEKLNLEADVAGATFMAAGGSAPELFTSIIGVFVSFNDVGIGTIVGSAVFNILFVIGMCALFSKTVLRLTWWPLFRDCTFYSLSLIILIYFFMDSMIFWYEALILLLVYCSYVGFMKFNARTERFIKKLFKMKDEPVETPTVTLPVRRPGNKFRRGLLQLMIHTVDPLHDDGGDTVKLEERQTPGDDDVAGPVDPKATQIVSFNALLDATKAQNGNNSDHVLDEQSTSGTSPQTDIQAIGRSSRETKPTHLESMNSNEDTKNRTSTSYDETPSDLAANITGIRDAEHIAMEMHSRADMQSNNQDTEEISVSPVTAPGGSHGQQGLEEPVEPIDIAWPKTLRKRFNYILIAPIIIPLYFTLPDTRKPRGKRLFPITFLGSILWIAAYSYLMVWWATLVGETVGMSPEVMGLTVLAAGTSIPDLITSVIVARKGLGDMAVSSSVGSNIFDITVGLPLPWIIYGMINLGEPVPVQSEGMVCPIVILFCMLLLVFLTISFFRWKMNKGLGVCMFLLYFVFVAVSLLFKYGYMQCFA